MRTKTNNLQLIAEKTGLRVSKEKTKVMRANNKQQDKIKLKGEELEDVKSFTYLGSIITKSGGTEEDVKSRICKARLAFNAFRPVWNASSISTKTKLCISTTNVIATLPYGSETWKVTEKVSSKELWSRTGHCRAHTNGENGLG